MRWTLVFFLLLISPNLFAATHHIPLDADDQGPNLPTVGSSLFDKIYSRTTTVGSAVYDVPYPLEKLLGKVNERGGDFVHALFPFSRSLQRPQDLSYDPLTNPRLVFAPSRDQDSITRGKIFFGFVKAKDQLEVISYNDEAGRFEYQIIVDYSKDPKVFYADRGKCLSCHQGQAPIFSSPAWQDSGAGVMGSLIFEKLGLERNSLESRKIAVRQLFGPIKSRDEIAMFDSLVRESNQIALDERTWLYGCGADRACRLGLLLNTLSPNGSETKPYIEHARDVINRSPLKEQDYFSSFLTSSSFGTIDVIKRYGSIGEVVGNPQAILDIIGLLYNLTSEDNPATPRPRSLKVKDLATPLAGFLLSDRDTLRREVPDTNQVAEILIRRHNAGDPLFDGDSIHKIEVMRTVLADAGSPVAEDYAYWSEKPTPAKVLFEGPLPPVFRRMELNLFSRHCYKCHAIGMDFPPQFLLGEEREVMENMKSMKGRIRFKLENNLMPPNRDDREVLKGSGDYERMVSFLNEL